MSASEFLARGHREARFVQRVPDDQARRRVNGLQRVRGLESGLQQDAPRRF
jgi:hypothetical protein